LDWRVSLHIPACNETVTCACLADYEFDQLRSDHSCEVVVAVDSHPILGLPGLTASLYLHPPAENLTVVVLRGSQRILLNIPAIEHRDEMDQLAGLVNPKNRIGGLGVFAVDFTPQLASAAHDVSSCFWGRCGRTDSGA
jgi:hypothetical protein